MEIWAVSLISVVALILFYWKEFGRKDRSNLYLRLAATLVAIISLYFVAQPLRFQRKLNPTKQNTAIILTEGFRKDSLSRFKNIPTFTADPKIAAQIKNITIIPDIEHFIKSRPEFKRIEVFGNGLEQHELELMTNRQIYFHPSPVENFTSVHWNDKLGSGDKLRVQGSFQSGTKKSVKILLRGLNTTLDSMEVEGEGTFTLKTQPKLIDKTIYSLVALRGRDTLAAEEMPVIIEEKRPLRLLMLLSSPNFESKFLKNWLYSENYAISTRTKISRNKYGTEFLNTERGNISSLGSSQLENFDIVIGDMTELSSLPGTAISALQNQIAKGLGLVILADASTGAGFFRNSFFIRPIRPTGQKLVKLSWLGETVQKQATSSELTPIIVARPGEKSLVKDERDNSVASSKQYGAGRIVITTIVDSYTWMLSDKSSEYASYWTNILEKVVRRPRTTETWTIRNNFPVVHQPIELVLETTSDSLPKASASGVPLHFSQDATEKYRWTTVYWPDKNGWQPLKSGVKSEWLYVYDAEKWQSVRASQKIKNNVKFSGKSKGKVSTAEQATQYYRYEFPSFWFYCLFLLACGYLWIEQKGKLK